MVKYNLMEFGMKTKHIVILFHLMVTKTEIGNGVSIYANTWNHALDIYDNNSGLTKYIRYF